MIDLAGLMRVVPGARLLPGPGGDNPKLTGLAYDSRQVQAGHLFFCVRGLKTDGLRFLPEAIRAGAVAAVVESEPAALPVPALWVPSVREAMPLLSAAFFDYPSRRIALVGVTGTNGKTTTTYLVEAIARSAGRGAGLIGTIGARINGESLPGERTTPESPDLQGLLARMAGADHGSGMTVAMEVSSHALALGRTLGCEFDVGVFTNLTQDHLDYHRDMEEYFEAKALLFTMYPQSSDKQFTGVINTDDSYGRRLREMCAGRVVTYGVEREAEYRASDISGSAAGLRYRLTAPDGEFPVRMRLGALFNVYNSLGAIAAARALGIEWDPLVEALERTPGVPGRFESVDEGQDFGMIVDYAHSPDGLENVLRAGRALSPRRLITVFGCGGDRDRTKRPIMGRIAAELSDVVIVTSDNPRSENPNSIIEEIVAGISNEYLTTKVWTEPDRARAIEAAVKAAETGDLVVIAGKGHETYQIFADETVHFDDREQAREAVRARLGSRPAPTGHPRQQ